MSSFDPVDTCLRRLDNALAHPIGTHVVVHGLVGSTELNGRSGVVRSAPDGGRVAVSLNALHPESARDVCVKLSNLRAPTEVDTMPTEVVEAAREGRTARVRQGLMQGFDVNFGGQFGITALQLAAQNGHEEVVRLLLDAPDIDVNRADVLGWTALTEAVWRGRTDIIRLLLAAPTIDLNHVDTTGRKVFMYAVFAGEGRLDPAPWLDDDRYDEVWSLLLNTPGIDVQHADSEGRTARDLAQEAGKTHVVAAIDERLRALASES